MKRYEEVIRNVVGRVFVKQCLKEKERKIGETKNSRKRERILLEKRLYQSKVWKV